MKKREFIHSYSSCSRTYATLSIYHPIIDPQEITRKLKIKPDRVALKGDQLALGRLATHNVWSLGTKGKVKSKDLRYHLHRLAMRLKPRSKELRALKKAGGDLRLWCFWSSKLGNGGPVLDHFFMKEWEKLPVDIYFDIYFEPKT